jgi:hypothetical protein
MPFLKQANEQASSAKNSFPHRKGFGPILLILFLTTVMVSRADKPPTPMAYPWQKEGPPVRELAIQPITAYPGLLMAPADIPEVKRRFEAMPDAPQANPKEMGWPLYALLYGNDDDKRTATRVFVARVREVFTKDGKPGFGMPNSLSQKRRTNELLYDFDVVASFGYLTPIEIQEFKDHVVRVVGVFIGNDPTRFPCKATPNPHAEEEYRTGFAPQNRWTDAFITAGLAGLTFPDLPQAKAWVQYAIQQTEYQLEAGNLDGSWLEVPRYHQWTMLLWSGWLAALKNRTGVDLYKDPNLKLLADWQVRFSSPPVRFPELIKRKSGGIPSNPAWGDSDYENGFDLCAIYGSAYAKYDQEFSKRLMWMWRRAGAPYKNGWHFNLIFPMLVDPSVPDAPQTLGSAFSKHLGYIGLRSGFNTPEETWVTMRAGKAYNHKRNDLGSIDIFSHGFPLACGAQSGPYRQPEIDWNRWVGANNAVAFLGKEKEATAAIPNPYVDIPGLQSVPSGKPLAFFTCPTVDYAVADCSRPQSRSVPAENAFKWVRHLVLAKQPDYLLVWDQCDSSMAAKWFLHTTAADFIWEQALVTSKTNFGVDLDVHVLSPSEPLTPNIKEGPFGGWIYSDAKSAKADPNPYPFKMLKYFALDAQPNTDFVTVLQPRKSDAPKLKAKLISKSKEQIVVSVTIANHTDLITLTPKGGTYQRGDAAPVVLPLTTPENVVPAAPAVSSGALPVKIGQQRFAELKAESSLMPQMGKAPIRVGLSNHGP